VLGAVAGWGTPWQDRSGEPVVRWVWRYADGAEEELVLTNGHEFADWIARHDVPGSVAVEGLVRDDGRGQIRRMSFAPQRDGVVASVRLESAVDHVAPVFLALTAELAKAGVAAAIEDDSVDCFLFGGGSHHDFARWFGGADVATLSAGGGRAHYTEDPSDLMGSLEPDEVLVLSTNQPLSTYARAAITDHVAAGGGLLALHAGTWRNWPDWTELSSLLGASAASHEPLATFAVEIVDPDHPITRGLPARFEIVDELYRAEPHPDAGPIHVLAEGVSLSTGERYPVVWVPAAPRGRVVGITLGHDGEAHANRHFERLLRNAAAWLGASR
jgi:type 1 glutamine amidotransferase